MDNMNNINETPEQVLAPQVQAKKPGKVGTFFFCLWVIVAMILVQTGVSMVGIIPNAVRILMESGGDMVKYQTEYMNFVATSDIITSLQFIASGVMAIVAFIWYYFGYLKKEKAAGTYESVFPKLKDGKLWVFLVASSIACYCLANFIAVGLDKVMPDVSQAVSDLLNSALGGGSALGMICAVIFAPVGEELALRGIVVKRASRAYTVVGVAVISGILFGIFHMNPIQGLYAIPMGLLWGFIAYRMKSVIPTIFCHFVNNLIGMTIGDIINPDYSLVIFAVGLVVCTVVSIVVGKKCDALKAEA